MGRYVRLQKSGSFKLLNIFVYENNIDKYSTYELFTYPISSTITPNAITIGPSVNDADGTNINPFIQIDLGQDTKIKKIEIIPVNSDTSLNNCELFVIKNNERTSFKTNLINIVNNSNIIYTYNYSDSTYSDITNLNHSFNYPSCTTLGCITSNNKHIDKQKYRLADGRCVRAKGYKPISECLNVIDALSGSSMEDCFDSCSTSETRYRTLTGRFVRLTAASGQSLKVLVLKAQSKQAGSQTLSDIEIKFKHSKPATYANRSDLLNQSGSTPVITTGYIQIDLGYDVNISTINIVPTESISGSTLQVISQAGYLRFSTTISSTSISGFTIEANLNVVTTQSIDLIETYNYPESKESATYDGGLTDTYQPKPFFIYNITSKDLSIAITSISHIGDALSKVYSNEYTLSEMNNLGLSTRLDKDTRFPHAFGRYIRIERMGTSTDGFNLREINISPVTTETSKAFVWPKVNNTTLNTGDLPSPAANTPSKPMVQLDFGINIDISQITLETDDTSLNGCRISVINSLGQTVSTALISDIAMHSSYEMINIGGATYPVPTMIYTLTYPECKSLGCINKDNYHIYNQKYINTTDGRCFKTINAKLESECLSRVIPTNTLTGDDMNNCFVSCESGYDSRYPVAAGRYVRVIRTTGTNDILLSELTALNASGSAITPISAFSNNVLKDASNHILYGEYLIDSDSNTYAGCSSAGYLQIDLGLDTLVDSVKISSAQSTSNSLNNTKIQLIRSDGKIVSEYLITTSSITMANKTNTVPIKANLLGTDSANFTNTFTWPCNTNSDCVTSTGRSKPGFIYNLSNSRCISSTGVCNFDNCIENVNNYTASDASIMANFDSCNTHYSQFSPITGRYIRIRRTNDSTGSININNIIVYDSSGVEKTSSTLTTFVKPLSDNSYGKYMLDNSDTTFTISGTSISSTTEDYGYVQIDLGTDVEIGRIFVTSGDYSSLNNTELVVANNAKNIVYKKLINNVTSNTNYLS